MSGSVRRILAIRFSGLGDIVMLTGVFAALKQQYPGCHITLLADRVNGGILSETGGVIDQVICLNRSPFRQRKYLSALKETARLLHQVRQQQFDMVLDFQNFGETGFITRMAKADVKVGAPKKDKYAKPYTLRVPLREQGHRIEQFARIAQLEHRIYDPKLIPSAQALSFASELKKELTPGLPVVGLNIGSTQENRRWHHNHFAELARKLKGHAEVVVFAGPAEEQYLPAFEGIARPLSALSLPQLCGAIASCDVVVSNDTGPAHMAGALSIPLVTLFSTGDDEEVGAICERKRFIKRIPINDIHAEEVMSLISSLIPELTASPA